MRGAFQPDYARITVDAGCTLIVDGGMIDVSYGGGTWAGIIMESNSRARVEVRNGGTIKRARIGIRKIEFLSCALDKLKTPHNIIVRTYSVKLPCF